MPLPVLALANAAKNAKKIASSPTLKKIASSDIGKKIRSDIEKKITSSDIGNQIKSSNIGNQIKSSNIGNELNRGVIGNLLNKIKDAFNSSVNEADYVTKTYIGPVANKSIDVTKDVISGVGNVTSGVANSLDTKFNIVFRAIIAILLIGLIIVIILIIIGVLKPSDFSINSNNSILSNNSSSNYSTSSNKGYFNFISEMVSGYSLRIFGNENIDSIKDNNKSERKILNGRCNDINNITSKDNLKCIKNIKINNLKWEIDKNNESLDYNKLPNILKNKDKESIIIPFKLHDTGVYLPDCKNSYYEKSKIKTNLLENENMKNENILVCKLKDENAGNIYI